jgi:hypothetical protein
LVPVRTAACRVGDKSGSAFNAPAKSSRWRCVYRRECVPRRKQSCRGRIC